MEEGDERVLLKQNMHLNCETVSEKIVTEWHARQIRKRFSKESLLWKSPGQDNCTEDLPDIWLDPCGRDVSRRRLKRRTSGISK